MVWVSLLLLSSIKDKRLARYSKANFLSFFFWRSKTSCCLSYDWCITLHKWRKGIRRCGGNTMAAEGPLSEESLPIIPPNSPILIFSEFLIQIWSTSDLKSCKTSWSSWSDQLVIFMPFFRRCFHSISCLINIHSGIFGIFLSHSWCWSSSLRDFQILFSLNL